MREILSLGLSRTVFTLILGAMSSLYVVFSTSGAELSTFVVASVYIGFFSLGDFGLAPTIVREVAEKQHLRCGFGTIATQISEVFKNVIFVLLPVMAASTFYLSSSRDLSALDSAGFTVWCASILLNLRFTHFEVILAGHSFVQNIQTAQIISKSLNLCVLLLLHQYLGASLLFCFGLGALAGAVTRAVVNRNTYFKLIDSSQGIDLGPKRRLFGFALKMGVYYQISFAISKVVILYVNLVPDSVATNQVNILHQMFAFLFVFSAMPTTYLLPKYTSLFCQGDYEAAKKIRSTAIHFFDFIVFSGILSAGALLFSAENYELLNYKRIGTIFETLPVLVLFSLYSWLDERTKFHNSFYFASRNQFFLFRHVILGLCCALIYTVLKWLNLNTQISLTVFIVMYIVVLLLNFVLRKLFTRQLK